MAVPVHVTLLRLGRFLSKRNMAGPLGLRLAGEDFDSLLEHLQEGKGRVNSPTDVTETSFKISGIEVRKV